MRPPRVHRVAIFLLGPLVVIACSSAERRTHSGPDSTATTQSAPLIARDELERAEDVVIRFVESLGRGDVGTARSTVGSLSEARAAAAGGLKSLLGAATEGHGAWASSPDRVSTPIAFGRGLAVVVLQGTLAVEGRSEHRVAAFPVRRAASPDAWFVEPWAFDPGAGPPFGVVTPNVDAEEWASSPLGDAPSRVVVDVDIPGAVSTSFDARRPRAQWLEAGRQGTFVPAIPSPTLVTILFERDQTLAATAFVARSA